MSKNIRITSNELLRSKNGWGWGRGGSIIKTFWPIALNDLWSKKIFRSVMIVWSPVLHSSLNDLLKKNPQEKLFTEKLLIIQSRCKITPLPQNCLFWLVKLRLFYESWQKEENWRFQIHTWHKFWQHSNNNLLKDWHFIAGLMGNYHER